MKRTDTKSLSFQEFFKIYGEPLKLAEQRQQKFEYCLFEHIADMCSGWNQHTFKSKVAGMTNKGSSPIPLVYTAPFQMDTLSSKKECMTHIFKQLNYRGVGRVSSLELIGCILLALNGSLEDFFKNVILIFGFTDSVMHQSIT